MAYEDMTYEVILKRMIDRVTAKYPNLDNREGSIIYNALAPAALEMAIMYTELNNVLNESFVNTASREYILIACQQMGIDISQFDASAGVHKGEFDVEVEIGSRWNCDLFNYTVTQYIGKNGDYYAYQMECDTVGTAPNNQTGDLTPITNVPSGLTHAKIVECLLEGENETSDEDIRTAYFEYVSDVVSDGNIAQYERWCREYDGIGHFKIFPLWKGANTVKVSILNTSNTAASTEPGGLVDRFQQYLDPGITGMGDGVAPIGAFVTVTTANQVPISVSATVSTRSNFTDTSLITQAITDYLASIAYKKNVVAYMNVGAVILGVDGVESVNDLKLNGVTSDIQLDVEDIPVLRTADWTVAQ